eukprot:scaffold520_cov271-Chaetoceros_neogracile.AAC.26
MSKDLDDKWPVEVFRYSNGKGWELFQQASSCPDKVTASPRRNCVEVRTLRLRIHILQQPDTKYSQIPCDDNDKKKKRSHTASVVRRKDTLLLSKGDLDFGAVVLKFKSIADCVAFTDRLTELNQGHSYEANKDKADQRPARDVEMQSGSGDDENDGIISKNDEDQGNFTIQSHLISLLHDKDFLGFVDRLEHCLTSNSDCVKMLQAHEHRHGSS